MKRRREEAEAKAAEIERKKEKEAEAKRRREEAEEVVGLSDRCYLCEILLMWTIVFNRFAPFHIAYTGGETPRRGKSCIYSCRRE